MKILVTSILDLKRTAHNPLHQFLKHLQKAHRVSLLSLADWWKADTVDTGLYNKDFKDLIEGIDITYLSGRRLSPVAQELSSVFAVRSRLHEMGYRSFDVHFSYSGLFYSYLVARRFSAAGKSTVYHMGDDVPRMVREAPQMPAWLRVPGAAAARQVVRWNVASAARVTYITSSLGKAYGAEGEKGELLPNGVDTELFSNRYDREAARHRLGISPADFVLGYVGVLREWVDLEPVFAAARSLVEEIPGVKVLIVGEEGGLQKQVEMAGRHSLSGRVFFTGTVPYGRVPEHISCMDVCLIPFRPSAVTHNALPMKLFEYMSCGKAVVSTRLRGTIEAAGDRARYASDAGELARELLELYRSPETRERLGHEGRRFVEEKYSWKTACLRLESILLEASRKPR